MKTSRLLAPLVAVAVVILVAADASAYYNPATGRFLQRDPGAVAPVRVAGSAGPTEGGEFVPRDAAVEYRDGPNLYLYVRANPVRFVDPDGDAAQEPRAGAGIRGAAGAKIDVSVIAGGGIKTTRINSDCKAGAKSGRTIQGGGTSSRHLVLSQGCEPGTKGIVIQQIRFYGGVWKCSDLSRLKHEVDTYKQEKLDKGIGWEWFGFLDSGQTGPLRDDWAGAGYQGKGVFNTFGYDLMLADLKVYCLKDADAKKFEQANADSHGHIVLNKIPLWNTPARGGGNTALLNVWNCCECPLIPQFNFFLDNLDRQERK